MGKVFAKTTLYFNLIVFLLVGKVESRHLSYNATELVSGGVGDGGDAREEESFLQFKKMDSSEEQCELMYGFLPCSSNIPSHIFLIVVYEYLLYHGESYAGGDGRIFRFLGKNFFVLSFSQLLDSLPDALILLATGLSSSKEKAQEYVVTGAGLLAGSSILLLTLLWGVCFICGRTQFYVEPGSEVENRGIQLLTGSGVLTDAETSYHAKVMFFSLIPFLVILLPSVFGVSYSSEEYKIVLLVSLSASIICLFSYFYYQRSDPRISNRRLEYAEVEHKVEMHVPFYEVRALMLDREKKLMFMQKRMEKRLKDDNSKDKTMTGEKFSGVFEEWLDNTTKFMDDPYSLDNSVTEYNQVMELLLEDKNKLIQFMMEHAVRVKLCKEDGTKDVYAIARFFESIDTNTDGSITETELKNYIKKLNSHEVIVDDEIADIIMRYLDIDGNGNIDKQEFMSGFTKWLAHIQKQSSRKTDKYKQDKPKAKAQAKANANAKAKANADEKWKAIILLIVGILMLTFLAEPLVESVRKFSDSVDIEPFYVSFILVPLATNARTAIAAIRGAKQKRHSTTSLTFSEIYHKVFMNNILGFSVLVSVIYFRGLTWHFSAEILVVIIVCIIMGLLASFKSKFPNWTLLIAFPLYPLSLLIVYFVNDAFQFT